MKWRAAQIQKPGLPKFVLLDGVLYWGLSTAILWTVGMYSFGLGPTYLRFLIFPAMGLFFGTAPWFLAQRIFKKGGT